MSEEQFQALCFAGMLTFCCTFLFGMALSDVGFSLLEIVLLFAVITELGYLFLVYHWVDVAYEEDASQYSKWIDTLIVKMFAFSVLSIIMCVLGLLLWLLMKIAGNLTMFAYIVGGLLSTIVLSWLWLVANVKITDKMGEYKKKRVGGVA